MLKVLNRVKEYIMMLIKWITLSIIVGIICGNIGSLFHILLDIASKNFGVNRNVLFLLPVSGVVIVFLYQKMKFEDEGGTNKILTSLRSYDKIPILMAPLIFIGTILTHAFGGSSGREGAALQIGGSIGSFLGMKLKLNKRDIRTITMCGMSAFFATLFGTPLTATIFSLEVINVGSMYYSAFMPCLISSLMALYFAKMYGLSGIKFENINIPSYSIMTVFKVIILACLCAAVSIIFCLVMHKIYKLFKEKIENPYIRIVTGGVIIVALTLLLGTYQYNDTGIETIVHAIHGNAKFYDWFLKIIFTAVTLGSGYKGGEIVPTFFIGATFGNVMGNVIGLEKGFAASLGLVTMFCAVVNCPITSLILSIELFGSEGLLYFAIVSSVGYIMSGYTGLYDGQKIMYSKLETGYVNIDVNSEE